jgi:pyruvate formate lyase activating enzyme
MRPREVVAAAIEQGCPGVAFTYNEPVIWIEYVRDTAALCHEAGLFTVMVTNGYITQAGLDLLGEHIDVWRVDVKGARDETYRELCHVGSVTPVLEAAKRARHHWGMHVEVVTNIIPTLNDSAEDLGFIAEWIVTVLGVDTPWHVTRFFPYLDYAHLPPTPPETLRLARKIGRERGLSFVYIGNFDEPGGEDTVCPRCDTTCISRSGYTITRKRTRDGMCVQCGASLNLVE